MHPRGRIYWLTWALLVLGAAATGVASVQDAFFRGAFGAFLAPLALPLYTRAGPRAAAFLGLATGILWQVLLAHGYGRLVWSDELRAYAMSRFEIDLSVSAAAFAGAALAAALAHRDQRFGRAVAVGATLSLAMTALPYGFIRSSEAARMGPVEVTWLMPLEDIGENGRPVRPKGVYAPTLSAEDRAALREAFLVIDVAGETALVDTEGRRLWAVWRKRLHQPGREDGPVRRVFISWTEPRKDYYTHAYLGTFTLALPESPDGSCVIEHTIDSTRVVAGDAHVLGKPWLGEGFFKLAYDNWFSRLADNSLWQDPSQPKGQHAPAFLLLAEVHPYQYTKRAEPWDSRLAMKEMELGVVDGPTEAPMLWVLRREALETAREACDRPIPPSDRMNLELFGQAGYARNGKRKQQENGVESTLLDKFSGAPRRAPGDPLDKVPLAPAEPAPAAK